MLSSSSYQSSRKRGREDDDSEGIIARKALYAQSMTTLYKSFETWLKSQIKTNPDTDLTQGVEDCVSQINDINSRYLTEHGSILTFGSGDCGQAGHGIDDEADLAVRIPKIIASLSKIQVSGISCGGIHNALYTSSGRVYTWGCADDGSLGRVGDEGTPALVTGGVSSNLSQGSNIGLENVIVVGVACGDAQTMCITNTGHVWGWGCYKDKDGKQFFDLPSSIHRDQYSSAHARKIVKRKQSEPMELSFFGHDNKNMVIDIIPGSCYNIARCSTGEVYSWGTGECGELSRSTRPMKIPDPNGEEGEEIYDMQTVIDDYITPGPMYIQSSQNRSNSNNTQTKLSHATAVGAGAYHVLVVKGNKVYSTGLNNYGQLGHGHTDNIDYLTEIKSLTNAGVCQVKGGVHHSLLRTITGKLYAFGRGDSGQLGVPAITEEAGGFSDVSLIPGTGASTSEYDALNKEFFKSISCGNNHNLALTAKGEVYSWGYGDMLALGHNSDKDEKYPKKINMDKIKNSKLITVHSLDAGGQHSALIATME